MNSSEPLEVQILMTGTGSDDELEEARLDIACALSDIDPNDSAALLERALLILDDIHSGRF